jgi:hypothetical protein
LSLAGFDRGFEMIDGQIHVFSLVIDCLCF